MTSASDAVPTETSKSRPSERLSLNLPAELSELVRYHAEILQQNPTGFCTRCIEQCITAAQREAAVYRLPVVDLLRKALGRSTTGVLGAIRSAVAGSILTVGATAYAGKFVNGGDYLAATDAIERRLEVDWPAETDFVDVLNFNRVIDTIGSRHFLGRGKRLEHLLPSLPEKQRAAVLRALPDIEMILEKVKAPTKSKRPSAQGSL